MIPDLSQKVERQSWQQELIGSFTKLQDLLAFLNIPANALPFEVNPSFPLRVPEAFARKMQKGCLDDPLLRQVLPLREESKLNNSFVHDPLQESKVNPIPGLLHKFNGRVLLIVSQSCAIHCRYCFRQHFPYEDNQNSRKTWARCFEYIANDSSIQEVILSGGDPLNLTDPHLSWFFEQLSQIPHVKLIRLHTRTPVTIPNRLTPALAQALTTTRLKPVMVLHVNHPQELCMPLKAGIERLKQAGITVFNQSVLLKGVNDDPHTLITLSHKLFEWGIIPYYLHLLDHVSGSQPFALPEDTIASLVRALHQALPGYLMPKVVKEIPGAPCKVPYHLEHLSTFSKI